MDGQYVVTAGLIALALGYLAWRGWRTTRRAGCGGGCGAKAPAAGPAVTFIPADRLTLRPHNPDKETRNS